VTLKLTDKQAIVSEVADVAARSVSLVAADYRGLTVTQMTVLRAQAREAGVYLRVVRNTLARRAVQDTEFSCVADSLVGPLVLAFSETEPSASARLVRAFVKDNDALNVKFLSVSGKLLQASDLETLSKLPTKDEALSQLLSVMQAPITKMVRILVAPHEKLVRTLVALKEKKEAA
jgi:large subunit ribosomal protein L10